MKITAPRQISFSDALNVYQYSSIIEEQVISQIKKYCQSKKMLSSAKRFSIALRLLKETDYIHPEALWMALKQEKINISIGCVYSNLKLLEDAGVASSITDHNRLTLYKIIS